MEIKLTKEQYEKLVDLVYLGNWMINSYRTDDRLDEYDKVAEQVMAHAPSCGLKDKVEFDEVEGRCYPTRKLDEELRGFVDDYDDEAFWDLVVVKLAERDMVKEFGEAAVDGMGWDEYEEKREPFLQKYLKEIEENGIDNLEIYRIS